jgi:hypothetical protein
MWKLPLMNQPFFVTVSLLCQLFTGSLCDMFLLTLCEAVPYSTTPVHVYGCCDLRSHPYACRQHVAYVLHSQQGLAQRVMLPVPTTTCHVPKSCALCCVTVPH